MGLFALIFYLFFGVNLFFFLGLLALQQYLAIITRVSSVFALGEHKKERQTDIPYEQVGVELKNTAFSWGFKVSSDQKTEKVD